MLGRELEEMEENYDWTFNFLHPFPLIVLFLDLALAKENKKINCEFAILIFSFASQIQRPYDARLSFYERRGRSLGPKGPGQGRDLVRQIDARMSAHVLAS